MKMKYIPGRFVKIRGMVLRARKRTNDCEGCVFNSPITCLSIGSNVNQCILDGVIFTKQ